MRVTFPVGRFCFIHEKCTINESQNIILIENEHLNVGYLYAQYK